MSILKKINDFRRTAMRNLTKNIGKPKEMGNISLVDKKDIKRVLICRPNGRLGNILLITPLVQEVTATFPNCKVDLFVKGTLTPIIFENYDHINKVIALPKKPFKNLWQYLKVWVSIKRQKYDIVINADQSSSSGRLAAQFSNAKYKFFGDVSEEQILSEKKDYEHIAKYPVYNFRIYLTKLGIPKNNQLIASLDLRLSPFEKEEGKKILNRLGDESKKTICIFTYATGNKCLSEDWWGNFYENLKTKYKNYNIVEILPVENVSQIGFQATTFYSKDIREIGAVITNADLFIGADSGIMHLASSVQTPTVGLFSVTHLEKYEPYDNGSIGVNVNTLSQENLFEMIYAILENGKLKIYSDAV